MSPNLFLHLLSLRLKLRCSLALCYSHSKATHFIVEVVSRKNAMDVRAAHQAHCSLVGPTFQLRPDFPLLPARLFPWSPLHHVSECTHCAQLSEEHRSRKELSCSLVGVKKRTNKKNKNLDKPEKPEPGLVLWNALFYNGIKPVVDVKNFWTCTSAARRGQQIWSALARWKIS